MRAPTTECHRGPGGLRLIVRENYASPVTALVMCFLGGSRRESPRLQGISYFSQKLLLKGTSSRTGSQVAEAFESLGASFTPFSSKDVYGASLAVLTRNFPQALALAADCLQEATFAPDEVEKERAMLLQEIARRQDDVLRLALETSEGILYRNHPYRFPITGVARSISAISADTLHRWHQDSTLAPNCVMACVGDIRSNEVQDLVFQAMASLPARPVREPALDSSCALQRPHHRTLSTERRQAAVALAFPAPSFRAPDFAAFHVAHQLLSGVGSRLFREIRDRQGLAYLIDCALERRKDSGCFRVFVGTNPEHRGKVVRSILEQLERLRSEPLSEVELRRAKQYLVGLQAIHQQRKLSEAFQLAFHELIGWKFRDYDTYSTRIRRVDKAAVSSAIRDYLDVSRYACAHVVPRT